MTERGMEDADPWYGLELNLQEQDEQGRAKMGLTVSSKGSDFETIESGSHIARAIQLIDLGTQHTEYEGKQKLKQQLMIRFETPNAKMQDGTPFIVNSTRYTAQIGEKATLRAHLEQWRGKQFTEDDLAGFSLANVLGKACLLNVIHEKKKDKTRVKIAALSPLPTGITCPPPINEQLMFDVNAWDDAVFAKLPKWIQDVINASEEAKASGATQVSGSGGGSAPIDDSDIPF